MNAGSELFFAQRFHRAAVATPTTRDLVNNSRHDFGFLDGQFTADGVVMKGSHRRGLENIKSREVAAGVAAITSRHGWHRTGFHLALSRRCEERPVQIGAATVRRTPHY